MCDLLSANDHDSAKTGGLLEIAAGAAAIAGLKIVAFAHNLSLTEAALYLKNDWVGANSLTADSFRGHGDGAIVATARH